MAKDTRPAELIQELAQINAAVREHKAALQPIKRQLASKLKSEYEGRGKVDEAELNKLRKAFWAAYEALKEE
ncbi:MAG: hypothetical protein ACFFD2_29630 [Promethearchaeota archaeon]